MTNTAIDRKQASSIERGFAFAVLDAAQRLERHLDHGLSYVAGLSLSEYQILAALDEQTTPRTRVHLAEDVGLTPSGVTRALRPLEKRGLVQTQRDERDARRSLAALTSAGRKQVREASRVVDDVIAGLRPLTSETPDLESLSRTLEEVGWR